MEEKVSDHITEGFYEQVDKARRRGHSMSFELRNSLLLNLHHAYSVEVKDLAKAFHIARDT